MRKLLLALLVLALSVAAALWLERQGGFVVIALGGWTVQTTPLVFGLLLAAALVGVYLLLVVLRGLLGLPGRYRDWAGQRRANRARAHLIDGMIRLAEGRYDEAAKLLLRDAGKSDVPLLHYLAMAVTAQRQGSYQDRDHYLRLADKTSSKARLAVGLTQAQLQMEAAQWEQALATLNYLYEQHPHHPRLLVLLVDACRTLNEWDRLDHLLPELRRQRALPQPEYERLAREVAARRLENAVGDGGPALQRIWAELPRQLTEDTELLQLYCDGLMRHGQDDEAERLLRARLQKEWHPGLLRRYGGLRGSAPDKVFAQLEKWLRDRPDDGELLYAAGRQALRAGLWGRARSYLEAAAARQPSPEVCHTLGALLEQLGEREAAHDRYRQGLELISGGTPWQNLGIAEPPQLNVPQTHEQP